MFRRQLHLFRLIFRRLPNGFNMIMADFKSKSMVYLSNRPNGNPLLIQEVEPNNDYNGFNLIMADFKSKSMVYLSNRPNGNPLLIQEVEPGIHVLSNAKLDSPWPKAERLKRNFKMRLGMYGCGGGGEIPVKEMVETVMRDKIKAHESHLPNICSLDWELNLSSIFVEFDTPLGRYGTRSTAAITVKDGGEVSFYEVYFESNKWKEKKINYHIHNY